jgi:hypothetical protein
MTLGTRTVYDEVEYGEVVAERNALAARVKELESELLAYQVADSDADLIGKEGIALIAAMKRIEEEDIPVSRQTSLRLGKRWLVGDLGLADTLLEALAMHDKGTIK